jgi:hypothetical protein
MRSFRLRVVSLSTWSCKKQREARPTTGAAAVELLHPSCHRIVLPVITMGSAWPVTIEERGQSIPLAAKETIKQIP